MKETLLVVDCFLSNLERAAICEKLILQLRKFFPEYKILLINKSKKTYGIESSVDYYFEFGDSFIVGFPSKKIIETKYHKPYVFFETDIGTVENWLPICGVTDHVGGILNSFILSSKLCNLLGFKKVFKFEFDTEFDENDLKKIRNDIEIFDDYIIYGLRHEGQYTKLSLIDVHIIGFTPIYFEGFEILRNEDDFWKMCEKINYYGKWIEYIIFVIFSKKTSDLNLRGITYNEYVRKLYSKSKFDKVNSPGLWVDKWKKIPMICRLSSDSGLTESTKKVVVFFLNKDYDEIQVETTISSNDKILYNVNKTLCRNCWHYNEIEVTDTVLVKSKYISKEGTEYSYSEEITQDEISNLNYRWIKS